MPATEKIVIVVFDGLRPDMIAGRMPHLSRFLEGALWFAEASSVFPSVTRVATTSTATGAWPGTHGIVDNLFHLPGMQPPLTVDTSRLADLDLLERRLGAMVTAASLGECLAAAGKTMTAVHCGSVGSALLINHTVRSGGHRTFSIHDQGASLSPDLVARAIAECGPLPSQEISKLDVVAYAGRVARTLALGRAQADVTLIWLPEPDTTYHFRGIDSPETDAVMGAVDEVFAEVVHRVRSGPLADSTAIVAMSDHGQIATTAFVDLVAELRANGFDATATSAEAGRLVVTAGNAGQIRLVERDDALLRDVAHWLMARNDIGMVFADPESVPGALPPASVGQNHTRVAELVYVMRSFEDAGPGGIAGYGAYTGGVPLGGGMHGGLNRYEMNTLLAFDVPGGRKGEVDDTAAALIDVAPTVLDLLGCEMQSDGRVLSLFEREADEVAAETVEARFGSFAQQLERRRIGRRLYLHRGGRST